MSSVQYLAGFHCPTAGIAASDAHVLSWKQTLYVSNGTKFVYMYDIHKRRLLGVFLFPNKVLHIVRDLSEQQLFILCVKNGIYFLDLDEQGRCVMEPTSATSGGNVNIFSVGPESCCLSEPTICSFTVVNDVLVTACTHPGKWAIKLFRRTEKASTASVFREMEISMKHPPTSTEEDMVHPVLQCVTLWKEKGLSCDLALDTSLFTAVFGLDCALLKSPMIICGFPDGQIACFPLNAAGLPRSQAQGQPPQPVKILYHLEQPVVFIGATRLELTTSANSSGSAKCMASNSLLFLGCRGLLVTLTHLPNTQGETYEFREYYVQSPVSCAVCSGSCIYYSTCSDLLSVTIPAVEKPGVAQNPILPSASHNVSMVVALSLISSTQEGHVELIAVSNKGRLLLYKLSQRHRKTEAGKRIKALLSGIGTLSDRVSKLRSILDQKTRSLLTLNQVLSLSRVVLSSQSTEWPVHCEVKVSWTHILQKICFNACCMLQNNTDCALERGWKLCVFLQTDTSDTSTSYTFPVNSLQPGERTELCFPLSTQRTSKMEFPIKVSCTLFYNFKDITADFENSSNATDLFAAQKQGVCLPLQEHIIDVLQCFRLKPNDCHPSPATSERLPWDLIQAFLHSSSRDKSSSAVLRGLSEDVSNQSINYTEPLKARVHLSAPLYNQALKNEKSGASVCCSVLHWLLGEKLTSNQSNEDVYGVTPNGKELVLRVREVSVGESSGVIPIIEIEIESSYLDALACVHMAVINRLKTLVLQNKKNGSNIPEINLKTIQEQFLARESSLKEVQALRDRLCVQKELNWDVILQRLLLTYRALRDPGLLIL
ncbi:Fanconi anemia core complex-associated protein 100 [Pelodytes ibericus]